MTSILIVLNITLFFCNSQDYMFISYDTKYPIIDGFEVEHGQVQYVFLKPKPPRNHYEISTSM